MHSCCLLHLCDDETFEKDVTGPFHMVENLAKVGTTEQKSYRTLPIELNCVIHSRHIETLRNKRKKGRQRDTSEGRNVHTALNKLLCNKIHFSCSIEHVHDVQWNEP